jgi:ADP-ribose pyrophosphatase YjhB (NUDIX family)
MMPKRVHSLRSLFTSSTATAALSLTSSVWLSSAERACPAFVGNTNIERRRHFLVVPGSTPLNPFPVVPSATTRMFSSPAGFAGVNLGLEEQDEEWSDVLPYEDHNHNSAKIVVTHNSAFDRSTFRDRLQDTVEAVKEQGKSSVWVEVPMSRASLIEDMGSLGFAFHHAQGDVANLNLWLREDSNKVPEFATHHVGVGAVVVNSRDEILCVRELRKNFMPWKVPGGLADIGEQISEAAEREVMEETGIPTRFHSILSFRHAHGMANGRSDLFFVCRLDPIEDIDEDGSVVIPTPVPQECEIEKTEWIPMSQYRDMVNGISMEHGHPMMSHVLKLYDEGSTIARKSINSVVPGRKPNPMYHPVVGSNASE